MKYVVVDLTSGKFSLAEQTAYASAQQRQLREHYAVAYDGDGVLDEVRVGVAMLRGDSEAVPAFLSRIAHAIERDEAPICVWLDVPPGGPNGALGIHDRLPDGRVICNGYLNLATKYGDTITSILSHEVLEARADPRLHACVEFDDGTIWDREICDRVEADSYPIDGVVMSNFNTPACFEPWKGADIRAARAALLAASATDEFNRASERLSALLGTPRTPHATSPHERYDWMNLSTKPNQVRPGGYAQELTSDRGWIQHGSMRPYRGELAMHGIGRPTKRRGRNTKRRP